MFLLTKLLVFRKRMSFWSGGTQSKVSVVSTFRRNIIKFLYFLATHCIISAAVCQVGRSGMRLPISRQRMRKCEYIFCFLIIITFSVFRKRNILDFYLLFF